MKWNMPFVESRTFDTRLTKSALLRDTSSDVAKFQRPDYRQFKSNYPKESFSLFYSHQLCALFYSLSRFIQLHIIELFHSYLYIFIYIFFIFDKKTYLHSNKYTYQEIIIIINTFAPSMNTFNK